jgi:hypothetical protein
MRKQYHLQNSERGLLAWDVHRLIDLTSGLTAIDVALEDVRELNEPFWFSSKGDLPTCRRIAEHAKLMNDTSLEYPIILDADGRVMDGMHRVCKAWMNGMTSIKAFRLTTTPEPDYVGIPADQLPY